MSHKTKAPGGGPGAFSNSRISRADMRGDNTTITQHSQAAPAQTEIVIDSAIDALQALRDGMERGR